MHVAATTMLRQLFATTSTHTCTVWRSGTDVRRESLGSERAAVASLRSQMELAQQAVREEQLLAERLRQQASVASSTAQRRVRTSAPASAYCRCIVLLYCHVFIASGRQSARSYGCAASRVCRGCLMRCDIHWPGGAQDNDEKVVCAALSG